MSARQHIRITVNGRAAECDVDARKTLVDFLREDLELGGTHVGCEHGICGACTVLIDGHTARACLCLAVQADGHEVTTVEALQDRESGQLHAIQQAFIEAHGLQCGFCTPGFLIATLELLRKHPAPSEEQIREALSGHLCRCTGYQSILDAVRLAAQRVREGATL